MAATPPPLAHLGDNVSGWRWDKKREFQVGSTYAVLMKEVANQFVTLPFEEWLYGNITGSLVAAAGEVDWGMKFSIFSWLLWKLRRDMVLDGDYVERESVLERCNRLILEFESIFSAAETTPITDESGGWLLGFSRYIRRSSVLFVELWAVCDGLRHVWEAGFMCIELKIDNKEVTSICNGSSSTFARSSLVSTIHDLL
ncbi:hypothetical protein V6N12_020846 [Hibiscus sabdariffa]|uniref:RNase H type-1 domain-containing protein n=1 Tax=Hibiscus sabdariffa TaxID=183260 RepID=A0ABR2CZA6_9ROSI